PSADPDADRAGAESAARTQRCHRTPAPAHLREILAPGRGQVHGTAAEAGGREQPPEPGSSDGGQAGAGRWRRWKPCFRQGLRVSTDMSLRSEKIGYT